MFDFFRSLSFSLTILLVPPFCLGALLRYIPTVGLRVICAQLQGHSRGAHAVVYSRVISSAVTHIRHDLFCSFTHVCLGLCVSMQADMHTPAEVALKRSLFSSD